MSGKKFPSYTDVEINFWWSANFGMQFYGDGTM